MRSRLACTLLYFGTVLACGDSERGTAPKEAAGGTGASTLVVARPSEQNATAPAQNAAPAAAPEGCPAASAPTPFLSNPTQRVSRIALTTTHVYWYGGNAIYRQPKAGGSPEKVTDVQDGGGGLIIAASMLYWSRYPALFSAPLDGGNGPVRLVQDATETDLWTAEGSRVYYIAKPTANDGNGVGMQLRAAPSTGGDSVLLTEQQWATLSLAADATGVYWPQDSVSVAEASPGGLAGTSGLGGPSTELEKYTFSTGAVTTFAPLHGFAEYLQTAGGRVLWTDADGVWSSAADGSDRLQLGSAPLFRALASDGTSAYWAASAPGDEDSDIFSAPLRGGPARKLACRVNAMYGLVADENALYYYTWLDGYIGRIAKP